MGMFDQNGRQASKLDGTGFWEWVIRSFTEQMPAVFDHWDDTRRTSWPGGPDRTDDVVAVLRRTDQANGRIVMIVELETEPERFIFQRLGIYELMLSMEAAANAAAGEEPAVGSVLIHLTGQRRETRLQLLPSCTTKGTTVEPIIVDLCKEDAALTLADIDAGTTALCILPWIPLMKGGGNPALIAEWKRVTMKEPSAERRSMYRDLALVFAELIKEQVNWLQGLEGWEMKVSQTILGWKREGKHEGVIEARRADLLETVRVRLQDPVPEPIRLAIEGTNDPDTLTRWFRAALTVQTLDELRKGMRSTP